MPLGDCTLDLISRAFLFQTFWLVSGLMLLHDYLYIAVYSHMHVQLLSICLCDIHLYLFMRGLFCCTAFLAIALLLHIRILISLSQCSPPGHSWGQIAALFISLVINITQRSAPYSGNNSDNGTVVLFSLFCLFLLPASLL